MMMDIGLCRYIQMEQKKNTNKFGLTCFHFNF